LVMPHCGRWLRVREALLARGGAAALRGPPPEGALAMWLGAEALDGLRVRASAAPHGNPCWIG